MRFTDACRHRVAAVAFVVGVGLADLADRGAKKVTGVSLSESNPVARAMPWHVPAAFSHVAAGLVVVLAVLYSPDRHRPTWRRALSLCCPLVAGAWIEWFKPDSPWSGDDWISWVGLGAPVVVLGDIVFQRRRLDRWSVLHGAIAFALMAIFVAWDPAAKFARYALYSANMIPLAVFVAGVGAATLERLLDARLYAASVAAGAFWSCAFWLMLVNRYSWTGSGFLVRWIT